MKLSELITRLVWTLAQHGEQEVADIEVDRKHGRLVLGCRGDDLVIPWLAKPTEDA